MYQTNKLTKMSATTLEMLTQRVEVLEKQLSLLLDSKTSDEKDKKEKKEKKPKKTKKDKEESSDDEKPKKKRVSGYILFSNTNREEVKAKLTVDDEKPKNTDIMKELAKMWKELSDEERDEWNTKAKATKDEE